MLNVGIVGYGNVGKSLQQAIEKDNNINLVGIFSRRELDIDKYYSLSQLESFKDSIDVLLIAQGSAFDINQLMPRLAGKFNTVDSYDNHNEMSKYIDSINSLQQQNGKISIVAVGWDPGLLSIERALLTAFTDDIPSTFWGVGLSQGHSNAIRAITNVKDGIQLTIPNKEVMVQKWHTPLLKVDSKKAHRRLCLVDCEEQYRDQVEKDIKSTPDYFLGYQTEVEFLDSNDLQVEKAKCVFHAGNVIANDGKVRAKFCLELDNNAQFTAKIMLKYAKAIPSLLAKKQFGCLDCLDIPVKYLIGDKSIL